MTKLSAIALAAVVLAPAIARADGMIIIERRPPRPEPVPVPISQPFPLGVKNHHVTVEIKGQVAHTSVDQTFSNPLDVELEGTYVFPLPEDAAVDKFSMWIDGKETEAELLDKDKARAIYEGIVRSMRDPALVEYMGRGMFKARIFPIPAKGEKRVKISYAQLLRNDAGMCRYRYPLGTEKHSATPLERCSISVTLDEDRPIKAIYAPWQNVDVRRDGDKKAKVSWEANHVRVERDFLLAFGLDDAHIGMSALAYGRAGPLDDEGGTFLLFIAPRVEDTAQPKDVVFVLDTSGSMQEENRIEQARRALRYCIGRLDAQDRFGLIDFSTDVRSFKNELVAASDENKKSALEYVASLKARGGTAIEDSLLTALKMRGAEARPFQIVFLTDGEPTIGTTDPEQILRNVNKAAEGRGARMFVFGVGSEINASLLDKLAEQQHGDREYVLPGEDIEVAMSNFYEKVASPVLSDLELTIDGDVRCRDMYPNPRRLPDLFKGGQLAIAGRFVGDGSVKLKLTGTVNGKKQEFSQTVPLKKDPANEFLPRIWAQRKIGFLLDEIRLRGEKTETKDELIRLARAFGIPTPYTSWLVVDEAEMRRRGRGGLTPPPAAPADDAFGRVRGEAEKSARDPSGGGGRAGEPGAKPAPSRAAPNEYAEGGSIKKKEQSGDSAARDAKRISRLSKGDKDTDEERSDVAGLDKATLGKIIQQVGSKTFYSIDGAWVDSAVDGEARKKAKKIVWLSDDYFALTKSHPEAAPFLALGSKLVVKLGDEVVEIVES